MTTTLVLLVAIALGVLATWHFNRMIDEDGLGHRPPPPSHYDDLELGSEQWAGARH